MAALQVQVWPLWPQQAFLGNQFSLHLVATSGIAASGVAANVCGCGPAGCALVVSRAQQHRADNRQGGSLCSAPAGSA